LSETFVSPAPLSPLYRADRRGLKPQQPTSRVHFLSNGREYTSATTNFDLACAFAVRRGYETGVKRSVYEVELEHPTWDGFYLEETGAGCWESESGTVRRLVEDDVAMTLNEANAIMSAHAVWTKWSKHSQRLEYAGPMYDADGYAAHPTAVAELRQLLRQLGQYPDPKRVNETVHGYYV
jgi:hypothetical protein